MIPWQLFIFVLECVLSVQGVPDHVNPLRKFQQQELRDLQNHNFVPDELLQSISHSFAVTSLPLEWPFSTNPVFNSMISLYSRVVPSSRLTIFCPLISDNTRNNWESFSQSNYLKLGEDVEGNITSSIFNRNEDSFRNETGPGPYCPVWQHYPLSLSMINFNLLSIPDIAISLGSDEPGPLRIEATTRFPFLPFVASDLWLISPVIRSDGTVMGLVVSLVHDDVDATIIFPPSNILLDSISETFSLMAVHRREVWPFVINPVLALLAQPYLSSMGIEEAGIYSCPIVTTANAINWESFVNTNVGRFITNVTEVSDIIYRLDNSSNSIPDTTEGPFCPVWQHEPLRGESINFNMFSLSDIRLAFENLTSSTTASVKVPVVSNAPWELPEGENSMWLVHGILAPTMGGSAELVGLLITISSGDIESLEPTETATYEGSPVPTDTQADTSTPNAAPIQSSGFRSDRTVLRLCMFAILLCALFWDA